MPRELIKSWFSKITIEVIAGILAAILLSLGAAIKGYFEISPVISVTAVVVGTLVITLAVFGIRKAFRNLKVLRLGRELVRIFKATTEIRNKLNPEGIKDMFKIDENPERSIYRLLKECVERSEAVVDRKSEICNLLDAMKVLLASLKHAYTLQRSLETMVAITSQLVKLTREEYLSGFFDVKDRKKLHEREISELLGCLENVFEQIIGERVVAVLKIPKDENTLRVIHSTKANPDRVLAEPALPIKGSLGGYVLTRGLPLIFNSLEDANLDKAGMMKDAWSDRSRYFSSGVLYPVVVNGKAVAALGVDCKIKHAFQKEAPVIVRYAADAMAILFQLSTFLDKINRDGNGNQNKVEE